MKTITMTELNQRVSSVTRRVVEDGESIQVTNRGSVVMWLVPATQASQDPVGSLVAAGLAVAPQRVHRPVRRRPPVALSGDLDEILAEINRDADA